MNRQYYEKVFSNQRMQKYFQRYPDNEQKAILHYQINIEVSESFYPILSMLEVALRNSLNRELIELFGTEDWYLHIGSTTGLRNLNNEINTAKRQIANRNETITDAKIIAELNLGFWVKLLNAKYERILWKSLRKAFPYLEKSLRQRHIVSAPINKIRRFRNRVFHHEPICWSLNELERTHQDILKVMGWLNINLPKVASEVDRVTDVNKSAKEKLR